MRKYLLVVVSFVLVASLLGACASAGSGGGGTIKIATQSPLSGGQSAIGSDIKNGAQLGLEQLSKPLKDILTGMHVALSLRRNIFVGHCGAHDSLVGDQAQHAKPKFGVTFLGASFMKRATLSRLIAVTVTCLAMGTVNAAQVLGPGDDDDDLVPTGKGWGERAYPSHGNGNAKGKPGGQVTGNGINYHGGPLLNSTAGANAYYIWYGNWNGNTATSILTDLMGNIVPPHTSTSIQRITMPRCITSLTRSITQARQLITTRKARH